RPRQRGHSGGEDASSPGPGNSCLNPIPRARLSSVPEQLPGPRRAEHALHLRRPRHIRRRDRKREITGPCSPNRGCRKSNRWSPVLPEVSLANCGAHYAAWLLQTGIERSLGIKAHLTDSAPSTRPVERRAMARHRLEPCTETAWVALTTC